MVLAYAPELAMNMSTQIQRMMRLFGQRTHARHQTIESPVST